MNKTLWFLLGFAAGAVSAAGLSMAGRRPGAALPASEWLNPDQAPPSLFFSPHPYQRGEGDQAPRCCVKCGGGRLHSVHAGVTFDPGDLRESNSAVKVAELMAQSPTAM
jgi:hypothetical protein